MTDLLDEWDEMTEGEKRSIVELLAGEVRDLRVALTEFGRHKHGCASLWPTDSGCTCGFEVTLDEIEEIGAGR